MFSPYYAASRRRGDGDPVNHCAVNVALYNKRGKYWALTERRRTSLVQSESNLAIGNSALNWDGTTLTIDVEELSVPSFTRLTGRIVLHPYAVTSRITTLDTSGCHRWWPIAPAARVEVEMRKPSLCWSGPGYFDHNAGERPLEQDFARWTWSRAETANGSAVLYDALRRDGSAKSLAYRFDRDGRIQEFMPPPVASLATSGWRIARETRSDDPQRSRVIRTLEDTPFYARSLIETRLLGETALSIHESLSLDRFKTRWVQALLPFRMPRAFR